MSASRLCIFIVSSLVFCLANEDFKNHVLFVLQGPNSHLCWKYKQKQVNIKIEESWGMGRRLVDQRKMASTWDHLSDSFGSLHVQILDEEMLSEDFILWQNI